MTVWWLSDLSIPSSSGRAKILSYPRDIEADARLCESAGAHLVFHPRPQDMYEPDFCTYVDMQGLTEGLCGKTRPTHFRGVCTVVSKLFHRCAHRQHDAGRDGKNVRLRKTIHHTQSGEGYPPRASPRHRWSRAVHPCPECTPKARRPAFPPRPAARRPVPVPCVSPPQNPQFFRRHPRARGPREPHKARHSVPRFLFLLRDLQHQVFNGRMPVHIYHIQTAVPVPAHGGLAFISRRGGQFDKVFPGFSLILRIGQRQRAALVPVCHRRVVVGHQDGVFVPS